MTTRMWLTGALGCLCALVVSVPPAHAQSSNANTAALQVALKALHHYTGGIDGIAGRRTKRAIRRFQRSRGLPADGVAGPRTRSELGRRGRPLLGRRMLVRGNVGWDVAALQFMLRRRGYSPGTVDGGFGPGTLEAVKKLQAARGLPADGRVGRDTLGALRRGAPKPPAPAPAPPAAPPPGDSPGGPVRFLRPLDAPQGDGFGWVSGRNHTGIDFPAPMGTPIGAAGVGVVTFAGWNSGGYGNLMIVRHRDGYETWYAHQSGFAVATGASVAGGTTIGYVGSTGRSTGPHLHFEVRKDGVPIDPAPLLLSATSLRVIPRAVASGLECTGEGAAVVRPRRPSDPARAGLAGCRR
jgi:peptidoglycan hydrolase-like protein with peptidoglycan-binding domain